MSADIERSNLDAHVSLCELRYQMLVQQIDQINSQLTSLKQMIADLDRSMNRQRDHQSGTWHHVQWMTIGLLISIVGFFITHYWAR